MSTGAGGANSSETTTWAWRSTPTSSVDGLKVKVGFRTVAVIDWPCEGPGTVNAGLAAPMAMVVVPAPTGSNCVENWLKLLVYVTLAGTVPTLGSELLIGTVPLRPPRTGRALPRPPLAVIGADTSVTVWLVEKVVAEMLVVRMKNPDFANVTFAEPSP